MASPTQWKELGSVYCEVLNVSGLEVIVRSGTYCACLLRTLVLPLSIKRTKIGGI